MDNHDETQNGTDDTVPATAPASAADDLHALAAETPAAIAAPAPGSSRGSALKLAGIAATAVVLGAVGVAALQSSSSATPNQQGFRGGPGSGPAGQFGGPPGFSQGQGGGQTGQQGGQQNGQQGGPGFGPGGFAPRGTSGTVTAISARSITVKGTDGTTATYSVASGTHVMGQNGPASVSDISTGDTVFVHNEGTVAELILLGGLPTGGPGTAPGGGPAQANGTTQHT